MVSQLLSVEVLCQRNVVLSHDAQHVLAGSAEVSFGTGQAERLLHILGHSERHPLGHLQLQALLKADVCIVAPEKCQRIDGDGKYADESGGRTVVDVDDFARAEVHQDVVQVPIAQANGVPNHRRDRNRSVRASK